MNKPTRLTTCTQGTWPPVPDTFAVERHWVPAQAHSVAASVPRGAAAGRCCPPEVQSAWPCTLTEEALHDHHEPADAEESRGWPEHLLGRLARGFRHRPLQSPGRAPPGPELWLLAYRTQEQPVRPRTSCHRPGPVQVGDLLEQQQQPPPGRLWPSPLA
eukprot:scaffold3841_cov412-Prasinococcus_capsulatus_cf.AAC.7